MIFLLINLYNIQILKSDYYKEKTNKLNKIIYGSTPPRGKIYDRNGNLLVDNKEIKSLYFDNSLNTQEKLKLCHILSNILNMDYNINNSILADFWLLNNKLEGNNKITKEEYKKLENRELNYEEITNLKKERITTKELETVNKKEAYIYYLMGLGYYYDDKLIKKNLTDIEYAVLSEKQFKGLVVQTDWERVYPCGNTFKTILGSIGSIPSEEKDKYLKKGYSLNDIVGTSFLEKQYEDLLKGKKDEYILNKGVKELITKGSAGTDIYLTIDINLQKEVEKILQEEIIKAKQEPNTTYYNRSFAIISNPNTGEVLAMSGKQVITENGKFVILDYTPGLITSPIVVGSVIKGASHIVGYNTESIKPGVKISDECLKIAGTPLKCSWRRMGYQDDISALKNSSNVFQYRTAIKVGGGQYISNGPLIINSKAFDIYRDTFKEFGLGIYTQIDLPFESLGYIGKSLESGFLLDLATGQYDTYTPIQLNQYINAIANGGNRVKPHLLKSYDNIEIKPVTLNKVNTKEEYLKRVQTGFYQVLMPGGTGSGYIDHKYKPAGKTGTSESFIDTNKDGIIDTKTYTNTFSGYAPYDKPVVSFTVVSPDVSHAQSRSTYRTRVNSKITYRISKKFFEIY